LYQHLFRELVGSNIFSKKVINNFCLFSPSLLTADGAQAPAWPASRWARAKLQPSPSDAREALAD
jgi:hypothetical protein